MLILVDILPALMLLSEEKGCPGYSLAFSGDIDQIPVLLLTAILFSFFSML